MRTPGRLHICSGEPPESTPAVHRQSLGSTRAGDVEAFLSLDGEQMLVLPGPLAVRREGEARSFALLDVDGELMAAGWLDDAVRLRQGGCDVVIRHVRLDIVR